MLFVLELAVRASLPISDIIKEGNGVGIGANGLKIRCLMALFIVNTKNITSLAISVKLVEVRYIFFVHHEDMCRICEFLATACILLQLQKQLLRVHLLEM